MGMLFIGSLIIFFGMHGIRGDIAAEKQGKILDDTAAQHAIEAARNSEMDLKSPA